MNNPLYRIYSFKERRYLQSESNTIDYFVDLRGQTIYYKNGEFGIEYDTEVQLCTGKCDRNSDYMYCGDTIQIEPRVNGIIVFIEGEFKIVVQHQNAKSELIPFNKFPSISYTIIGNVHEGTKLY